MFALMPWTRSALLPRAETPDEFGTLFNRFFNGWPMMEVPDDWPAGWGITTEEKDRDTLVRFELPGFEPSEMKVDLTGDRLTIEAEHTDPNDKNKGKAYAHVKRMLTLPPDGELEKVEATYRNGILEVRIPRAPEAAGRRIEVKS